jgi:hypothetical protein
LLVVVGLLIVIKSHRTRDGKIFKVLLPSLALARAL